VNALHDFKWFLLLLYHRYNSPIVLIGLPIFLLVLSSIQGPKSYHLYDFDNKLLCPTQIPPTQIPPTQIPPQIQLQITTSYSVAYGVVIVSMFIIYPLHPFYWAWRGRRTNPEEVVFEYETIKKIIYVAAPLAVTAAILYTIVIHDFIPQGSTFCTYDFTTNPSYQSDLVIFNLHDVSLLILYATLLRMASMRIRNKFRLNLAKGYLILGERKNIDTNEKRNFVIRALNYYNKYLSRHLRLQIKDLQKRYYDFIISASTIKEDTFMDWISDAFTHNDELAPVRCISIFLNIPQERLLVKEQSILRIKNWSTTVLAAVVIPLIAALIPLFSGKH
jgi:hypothetical protein